MGLCVAASLALAAAYLLTSVPLYTATTGLLIDRGNNGFVNKLTMDETRAEDEGAILSQVEILKSETIALSAVQKLGLHNDPQFMTQSASFISTIRSILSSAVNLSGWLGAKDFSDDVDEQKLKAAVEKVQKNMTIARVGRSYVFNVSYTSPSPSLSARVSKAISDAYLTDILNSKYEATRSASDWLQVRIEELRQKALDTDLAVQQFRSTNGLLSTGRNGQLITDQQLGELNSALLIAQGETGSAKAKFERIQRIIEGGDPNAIVADVLQSSVVDELRKKYFAAAKLEADIRNRLGANHLRSLQLRGEMDEFRRLMFEELNRIAEGYKSEYDVAQAREREVQSSLDRAKSESAAAGETGVQLRELERSAETYRNLYQTFMQRYQEAIQQQSFPVTEARVITRPQIPDRPSHPRKPLIILFFGFVGAAAGAGIASFRELRDRYFRVGDQVYGELDLEYLGSAPLVAVENNKQRSSGISSTRAGEEVYHYAADHPLSQFAETLRSAKIAVDMTNTAHRGKVVGIVSTLPGEGKSTVAMNFAELLSMQGAKTLLIDCDLRNPGTTRALGRDASVGLVEVLTQGLPVREALNIGEKSKLAFLPAVVRRRIPHSSELLSSSAMSNLLEEMRGKFDYVILDLPPLGPVVDGRAIAPYLDDFIYIVEWGRTLRKVVRDTIQYNPEIRNKCAGVILNKVDIRKIDLYRAHGSSEYYYSRYNSYYRE